MAEHVTTPDGRTLEFLVGGADDGFPFVFHGGSPSAAVEHEPFWEAAGRAGLRLVTYSRPGYGGSSPWPQQDRPVPLVEDVVDTVTVLDHLGLGEFVTLGWSGGGPRALACAATLPRRCRAAASLAGVAPSDAPDLDFTAGMGPENVRDFTLAAEGREAFRATAEEEAAVLAVVTGDQIVEAFGGLVDEVDAGALTGEFADYVAATFRHAMAQGAVGFLDDSLQVSQPWGFDVADIAVPVAVWQGEHDRMVPFAHGRWLASHVPGARAHLFEDEGHLTLVHRFDDVLADLRDLAGLGAG